MGILRFLFVLSVSTSLLAFQGKTYTVVTTGGQVIKCSQKVSDPGKGMVALKLADGGEMTLPREQIDWADTGRQNGESSGGIGLDWDIGSWFDRGGAGVSLDDLPLDDRVDEAIEKMHPLVMLGLVCAWWFGQWLLFVLCMRYFGEGASIWKCLFWSQIGPIVAMLLSSVVFFMFGMVVALVAAMEGLLSNRPLVQGLLVMLYGGSFLYTYAWFMSLVLRCSKRAAVFSGLISYLLPTFALFGVVLLLG